MMSVFCSNSLILAPECGKCILRDPNFQNFPGEHTPGPLCLLLKFCHLLHLLLKTLQFITNFLLSKAQPLGNIFDCFYRVEYQQRGSPHIHMLIWLEDAPVFHVNTLLLHVLSFEISHTLSRSNEQQPTPCPSQCIISVMLCKSTCKTSVPY